MKHDPHTLVNVQALSEPQRAKHRRKVYSCYKAGMTKYAAAEKCRIQETTVGRWYRRFDAAGEEAYVRRAYGMSISRRTARRYMQRMGFTCQCPVKAARERNPAPVRKWPETDYPAIRKEAAESGSAIDWADESPVPACETTERGRGGCRGPRFESVGGPIRTRSPCGCRDGRGRPPPCCRRTATSSTS